MNWIERTATLVACLAVGVAAAAIVWALSTTPRAYYFVPRDVTPATAAPPVTFQP